MFTGIVQDVGRVKSVASRGAGRRLSVTTELDTADFDLGESVAVNGVCLTIAAKGPTVFEADASPETLRCSNLGGLRPGDAVNLERALRPSDRLGGHFVLGHVDATGRLVSSAAEGAFRTLRFAAPREVVRYLADKGSVAVDGVSLTVASVDAEGFSVAVIPHTLEQTNLPLRKPGDLVNLEVDVLAKYVERLMAGGPAPRGLTLEGLARAGFLR